MKIFQFKPALTALLVFGATLGACSGAGDRASAAQTEAPGTGALADMSLGNPDAPVKVIEYASVTCPHCAHFYETVFPDIKKDFIDTGEIYFTFREDPTHPAQLSIAGSMIARCAADKGDGKTDPKAFFAVVDTLFRTQKTWILADHPRTELLKIANQAGLDETAFEACIRNQQLLDFLNENVKKAHSEYNVQTTPSFIINGQLSPFQRFEDVHDAINEAVENATKK